MFKKIVRCLCGLERDCWGKIVSDGKIYKGRQHLKNSYMVMKDVNHQFFTDNVKSEVMLSIKDKDENHCDKILESLGLLEYKEKHPMTLSGGEEQSVANASAIVSDAGILLFNEQTSGLNYSNMKLYLNKLIIIINYYIYNWDCGFFPIPNENK